MSSKRGLYVEVRGGDVIKALRILRRKFKKKVFYKNTKKDNTTKSLVLNVKKQKRLDVSVG